MYLFEYKELPSQCCLRSVRSAHKLDRSWKRNARWATKTYLHCHAVSIETLTQCLRGWATQEQQGPKATKKPLCWRRLCATNSDSTGDCPYWLAFELLEWYSLSFQPLQYTEDFDAFGLRVDSMSSTHVRQGAEQPVGQIVLAGHLRTPNTDYRWLDFASSL